MRSYLILPLSLLFAFSLRSQPYTDYIGAGHSKGIIVTTSDGEERVDFREKADGEKTITGNGLEGKRVEASRFLSQAAFGADLSEIDEVVNIGIDAWLKNQYLLPKSDFLTPTDSFARVLYDFYIAQGTDPEEISPNPGWQHFRYAWWNNAKNGKDQLRQRVAFALSQILVISDESDLGGYARGLASYYDMLAKHSFGNYRDLLLEMTLHPCMGFYLSHLNNPKEIPEENIHPDQNFAREIMQLFTIGLFELNIDGTRKIDQNGNFIPTYNNTDIAELAKVFTGLGISASLEGMDDPYFGMGLYGSDNTKPMKMYEEWHQEGEKKFIQGITIPAGQTGMKDIEDAIDMLFNHPNTAPFVCRQLIQRLVTSNPTQAYLTRVASVFNDDGNGVRGNLKAVIHAILTDEEARSCDNITNTTFGKMIEPVLRHTNFLKGVGVTSPSGYFFNHGYDLQNRTYQHPLSSPSVFNFFKPEYQPTGPLNDANLFAPEFQLLNSITSLEYANLVFGWNYYEYTTNNWENGYFMAPTNASKFFENAHDDEALINQIDLLFTHGQMSDETRTTIKQAIYNMVPTLYGAREKINMALYLTLISPDYIIKK